MNFYVELSSGEKIGPYHEIKNEKEKVCMAVNAKGKKILLDTDFGEIQFPDDFDRFEVLFDREDGKRLYKLGKDGRYGVYDSDGQRVMKMKYTELKMFSYKSVNLIFGEYKGTYYGGETPVYAGVYTPFGELIA